MDRRTNTSLRPPRIVGFEEESESFIVVLPREHAVAGELSCFMTMGLASQTAHSETEMLGPPV
jgi:hypothetical protein